MNGKLYKLAKSRCRRMGGIFVWVFGPCDQLVTVLAAVVVLDYITGLINAFAHKKASSRIGWEGFLKKVFIFMLAALGTLFDRVVPSANGAVRAAVTVFYISNEGPSIIENAGAMVLPLPKALKDALTRLAEKSETPDGRE